MQTSLNLYIILGLGVLIVSLGVMNLLKPCPPAKTIYRKAKGNDSYTKAFDQSRIGKLKDYFD